MSVTSRKSKYLKRQLVVEDSTIPEAQFLSEFRVAVVLAEPGGGKTDFLKNIAQSTDGHFCRASKFLFSSAPINADVLIVDAMDEVARQDPQALKHIIVKASETKASRVVFACRAGVWEGAESRFVAQCFDQPARTYHLVGFKPEEQQELFRNWFPKLSAAEFFATAKRFEYADLLANPQLLDVFGKAFERSGGNVSSKLHAYREAVEQMAIEKNEERSSGHKVSYHDIVRSFQEISAKLLLSGCVGVSMSATRRDEDFPFLDDFKLPDKEPILAALGTELFKAAESEDLREPSHRTVQEYCAASYLVGRIEDASDLLSLNRCAAAIAPNGVCRDELKGLLAWMAACGGPTIQRKLIYLDPYAVLSNGDASQLPLSSKITLLERLRELSERDPYFRRSDGWRSFHAAGFFSEDLAADLAKYIGPNNEGTHLQGLLLELLLESSAASRLEPNLREILRTEKLPKMHRRLALQALKRSNSEMHADDFLHLLDVSTASSLSLAIEMTSDDGFDSLGEELRFQLLLRIADSYPKSDSEKPKPYGDRINLMPLVDRIQYEECIRLLDELSGRLKCGCESEHVWKCYCRHGLSEVIAVLLDRLFELNVREPDAEKVWQWCRGLVLQRYASSNSRAAVDWLSSNDLFRQRVHQLALGPITDLEEMRLTRYRSFFSSHGHPGLSFQARDYSPILDFAFETENSMLWSLFCFPHRFDEERLGADPIRAKLRSQANSKKQFMAVWARFERAWRAGADQYERKYRRQARRYKNREKADQARASSELKSNREQIEKGRDWNWLVTFANALLLKEPNLEAYEYGREIAESALANAFDFLAPHVPSLDRLAKGDGGMIVRVLVASCVVTFRRHGTLTSVPRNILWAVKTDLVGYSEIEEPELSQLNADLDSILFRNEEDYAFYLAEYIEPQLDPSSRFPSRTYWTLDQPAFHSYRPERCIHWLEAFPEMSSSAREGLFAQAVRFADRDRLKRLVVRRTEEAFQLGDDTDPEKKISIRRFWALRHFYFQDQGRADVEDFLFTEKEHVFLFRGIEETGRQDRSIWPQLSAAKVAKILKSFAPFWPKVPLPSSYGSSSPPAEKAYRFLNEFVYQIEKANPTDQLPVLEELLRDPALSPLHSAAKNIKSAAERREALEGFTPPSLGNVVTFLDDHKLATVDDLRALLVDELKVLQADIHGGDTGIVEQFYPAGKRAGETACSKMIVYLLRPRLNALGLSVVLEHQLAEGNRCDITVTATFSGQPKTLVIEVKGQWNKDLYTSAKAQLHEKYSIYPAAANQGIYLVLWFGPDEKVCNLKSHGVETADELKIKVEASVPESISKLVDVILLDVAK